MHSMRTAEVQRHSHRKCSIDYKNLKKKRQNENDKEKV